MANEVQEIKSRLGVEDLVAEYLPLKKAGMNFKACCPFHNEKSPSFVVSPQKQIWHCFGCGEGGDIFNFIEKIENVTFAEGLRMLAKKTGVVLQKANPKLRNEQNTLIEISALAQKFFHVQFIKSEHAKIARDYVENRGITKESINLFGIGYSLNNWDSLGKFMQTRKYRHEDLSNVGLMIQKDRGGYYDRFRHRLMFPIKNVQGEVVGFCGRVLEEEQKGGKYVNSPQSLIYNKSKVVYGLFEGKAAIKEEGFAVVVEGQMDVIANHQAGVKNVVASSGTAFTSDQLKLIKRYTSTLLFSFDADAAGEAALLRGVELALQENVKVKVIVIPDGFGKDPDDCIQKDPEVWKAAVKNALDIIEFYINKKLGNFGAQNGTEQSESINFVLHLLTLLPDSIEQSYWFKEISRKVSIDISTIKTRFRQLNQKVEPGHIGYKEENVEVQPKPVTKPVVMDPFENTYKQMFSLLFVHPLRLAEYIKKISPEMIGHEFFNTLYKKIISFYNTSNQKLPIDSNGHFDYTSLITWMYEKPHQDNDEEFSVFTQKYNQDALTQSCFRLILHAQEHYALLHDDQLDDEISLISNRIRERYSKIRIKEISKLLDQETDPQKIKKLSDEFNSLISYL